MTQAGQRNWHLLCWLLNLQIKGGPATQRAPPAVRTLTEPPLED